VTIITHCDVAAAHAAYNFGFENRIYAMRKSQRTFPGLSPKSSLFLTFSEMTGVFRSLQRQTQSVFIFS